MKQLINKFKALPVVLVFMWICMSMTNSVDSRSMKDKSFSASQDISAFMIADESWTWGDFFGNAVVGGVAGAVVGAGAGTVAGGVGAGPGAVAGGLAGAAGGALEYAGQQAWSAVFGPLSTTNELNRLAYSDAALD